MAPIGKVIRKLTVGLMTLVVVGLLNRNVVAAPKDGHGHEQGQGADADHEGENHEDEGRDEHRHSEATPLEFTDEMVSRYGIIVEKAQAAIIKHPLHLNGRVVANEDRLIHLIPRFPGIAKEVKKRLGDAVKKGEVLAVIESNQSLQPFEVKSPIDGTVILKHVSPGEFVTESEHIYVIADLGEVWVDVFVFEPDFGRPKLGQTLLIKTGSREFSAQVSFVSSVVDATTQSKFVRAVVQNRLAELYPGQFVTADLFVEEISVPLAVRLSGLQSIEGKDVVFVRDGNSFTPQTLSLAKRDDERAEVLSGIELGTEYATGKTFILKAEHGKSEAEHEH